jgi:lipoprotein NlpI/transglutaminase-like putative cysteine protease
VNPGASRATALLIGMLCAGAAAAAAVSATAPAGEPAQTAGATAPAAGYAIGPPPAWVVPADERDSAPVELAPMHYRLLDEQTRLSGKSETDYVHVVRVVTDSAGLAAAARIEIEFDPSFQKLTVHNLDLVRAGKHLTRLGKRYPLLRRETQLERQVYDGRETLLIVIDDVRVGDEIDYAFSITGSNPVFGGKFVHSFTLRNIAGPEALHQVRLLAPLARDIHYRTPDKDVRVTTRTFGEWRETVLRRAGSPRLSIDPQTPYSALLAEQLQFSEFADWAELARWGAELFAPAPGGPLLDQQAEQIKLHAGTATERLLAALDFVQKEVRYFGTENGASTHRPAPPEQVLKQRFGDCKDKVALLAALLARLDIEATPVLVSESLRGALADLLPSPLDFDHVIARVQLEGSTYWLDATRSHQSGALANRQSLGLGQGLVLAADTTQLMSLQSVYGSERVVARDTLRFKTFTDDPTLESRLTLRGDLAENLRESLAKQSLAQLAAQMSAPYLRTYPKARASAEMQVEASTDDDAVTLVQHFVIADFWRLPEPQGTLVGVAVPYAVVDALSIPHTETRQQPLALPLAGITRYLIVVEYPEDVYKQPPSVRFEDGDAYLTLRQRVQGTARRVEYLSELQINDDQVPAADWPAFAAKVEELHQKLGFNLIIPAVPLDQLDKVTRELQAAAQQRPRAPGDAEEALPGVRTVMLSAEIAGGRLPPHLEASVRAQRGELYAREGHPDRAAADFSRALELAPDAVEVLSSAAVNALQMQQPDRAIELASRALRQSAHYEEALETRARALYLSSDLAAARTDLEETLKDPASVRRGYPLVWLGFTLRQSAQDAAQAMPAYGMPTEWPRPLIDLAASRTQPEAVLRAARARKNSAESLCQAYFYIGEDYYTRGNLEEARRSWQKATEQGATEPIEEAAARWRLKSMPAK